MTDAAAIIRELGLQPHPEGGHYRESYRDPVTLGEGTAARGASTAIYYLLQAGERSHWHRVDAAEVWHWYSGAPLGLTISEDGRAAATRELGPDLAAGQRPQVGAGGPVVGVALPLRGRGPGFGAPLRVGVVGGPVVPLPGGRVPLGRLQLVDPGLERRLRGVDGRDALEGEPAHDEQARHVLGRVATVGSRGPSRRCQAVTTVPGAQGRRCDTQAPGDRRDGEARARRARPVPVGDGSG